jgi:hypothetical protein
MVVIHPLLLFYYSDLIILSGMIFNIITLIYYLITCRLDTQASLNMSFDDNRSDDEADHHHSSVANVKQEEDDIVSINDNKS